MFKQKGFSILPIILIIVGVVVIVGVVGYLWSQKTEEPNVPSRSTIEDFEDAVNKGNFDVASKYFADKVFVVLEGSECCGDVTANRATSELKRIDGFVFSFNPQNTVVKEYVAFINSQYPNRRLMKPSPNLLYFDEYIIGVESDVTQKHRAAIGYKISNDKITDLFIDPGRDR